MFLALIAHVEVGCITIARDLNAAFPRTLPHAIIPCSRILGVYGLLLLTIL